MGIANGVLLRGQFPHHSCLHHVRLLFLRSIYISGLGDVKKYTPLGKVILCTCTVLGLLALKCLLGCEILNGTPFYRLNIPYLGFLGWEGAVADPGRCCSPYPPPPHCTPFGKSQGWVGGLNATHFFAVTGR